MDDVIDMSLFEVCFYEARFNQSDSDINSDIDPQGIFVYDHINNRALQLNVRTYNEESRLIREAENMFKLCQDNATSEVDILLLVVYVMAFATWLGYMLTTCKCFESCKNPSIAKLVLAIIVQSILGILVVVPLVELYTSDPVENITRLGIVITALVLSFFAKALSIYGYYLDKRDKLPDEASGDSSTNGDSSTTSEETSESGTKNLKRQEQTQGVATT